MQSIDVDVLVIGWGKGGKTLARTIGRAGRRVAVVERSSEMYGGGCINIACVPTKALVHQAETRRETDDPGDWFASAVAGRDSLVEKLRARNHAMLAELDTVTLIDGGARFVGPHAVEVTAGSDRLRVQAGTVVINTGTAPARPAIDVDSRRIHDSTTIQHIDPVPRRLTVVGAGYVGLEFAGMFAHFGSEVTVVDRNDALLPHEDRDVADAVREVLEGQGITFTLGADTDSIDGDAAVVLLAVGREPVTADLGLDVAGVKTDDRGFIEVDEHLRTSAPGVFAVGDVNGGPQFTYISLDDHRIVLDQLSGEGTRATTDRRAVPSTTFITPPLARVGLNETQARSDGRDVLVAVKSVADIAAMPRPKIVGDPRGLIKIVVDAGTDEILGATLFCIDAQDVINLVALAIRAGVTATQLRDGIWTHPSTTEAFNEVLAELRP